jgi:hypothetical protein
MPCGLKRFQKAEALHFITLSFRTARPVCVERLRSSRSGRQGFAPTHRDTAAMNGAHFHLSEGLNGDKIDAWATCQKWRSQGD